MNSSGLESFTVPISTVSRCDRWQAQHRLQNLSVSCRCASDGNLLVEVTSPVAALQVRSVVQQLTASRLELVSWLERCWRVQCN